MSILTSESDGHVLNLNGEWGTGKTEFLKRLYVSLSENDHPVIYIDAWESDFTNDPLNVICSELLNQLSYIFSSQDNSRFEKIKQKVNNLLCSYLSVQRAVTISSATYKAFSNDPVYSDELDLVKTFLDINRTPQKLLRNDVKENNNLLLENIFGSQTALVSGMKDIRNQITAISEILHHVYELNTPIIVLVDELDRCRPDYAIKTLEVIKHFFDVEGCNFLIATDTKSLQESIKAVYGSNFDSERYLRRFFNQSVVLKRPSIREYLLLKNIKFKEVAGDIDLFPFGFNGGDEVLINFLSDLLDDPKLSLRDIERFLQKIIACLSYVNKYKTKNVSSINFVVLVYSIVTHSIYPEAYNNQDGSSPVSILGIDDRRQELSKFISHNVQTTLTAFSLYKYDFINGSKSEYNRPIKLLRIEMHQLNQLYNNKTDYTLIKIRDEIARQIKEYNDELHPWLMWNDYKNLVGLSDAIE